MFRVQNVNCNGNKTSFEAGRFGQTVPGTNCVPEGGSCMEVKVCRESGIRDDLAGSAKCPFAVE